MKKLIVSTLRQAGYEIKKIPGNSNSNIKAYINNGRVPWSKGYVDFKNKYVSNVLSDPQKMNYFSGGNQLPDKYGNGLDERCVEYPWFFANANQDAKRLLDAGSALNHEFVIDNQFWLDKELTILTLSPESNNFAGKKISYQFGSLTNMPFRDCWFNEIACISTLEHVGMDNSLYSSDEVNQKVNLELFKTALKELNRVLIPGGRLLLTVPYGKYRNWGIFQQFDKNLLAEAKTIFGAINEDKTIFRYLEDGWQVSTEDECKECDYSEYAVSLWKHDNNQLQPESDNAAAARAVACVIWQKGE